MLLLVALLSRRQGQVESDHCGRHDHSLRDLLQPVELLILREQLFLLSNVLQDRWWIHRREVDLLVLRLPVDLSPDCQQAPYVVLLQPECWLTFRQCVMRRRNLLERPWYLHEQVDL